MDEFFDTIYETLQVKKSSKKASKKYHLYVRTINNIGMRDYYYLQ